MFVSLEQNVAQEFGAQRRVHVQMVANKRRAKRGRKKKEKSTLTLHERVSYIFQNGSIADYTHPKEVDPFWDVLYRQYEYLFYVELLYKTALKSSDICFTTEQVENIVRELCLLSVYRNKLLNYMLNFMGMLYGSVIQSRFYGWKMYIDDFISKFNEVSMNSINKLKFNPDQTSCSVYFYQAFWLSGLSLINKISETLHSQYNEGIQTQDNNSVHHELEYSTILEEASSDELEVLGDEKGDPLSTEEIQEAEVGIVEDKTFAVNEYYAEQQSNSEEIENELFICLKKIARQLDFDISEIYSMSDAHLRLLGRRIKKEITAKTVVLSTHERIIINKVFKRKTSIG